MTARMRQLRPRDAVLFVAVAAVVAVQGVMIGGELGTGRQTAADAPPLSLSLSLPAGDFCETAAPTGFVSMRILSDPDEDGSIDYEVKSDGWAKVSEIPVKWTIIGGRPSYKLTIDGETRDAAGKYEGQRERRL